MNNSFEQLELIIRELSLDKKYLLVKLLNGQISGKSCLDMLPEHYSGLIELDTLILDNTIHYRGEHEYKTTIQNLYQ